MDAEDYFTHEELVLSRPGSVADFDVMKRRAELQASISSVLRNVDSIQRIAFDIGQTVIKICYSSHVTKKETTLDGRVIDKNGKCLHLHCIQVRLEDFESVLEHLSLNGSIAESKATFISTYNTEKYEKLICETLGLELHRIEQLHCLVHGTNFLIRNIEAECFTYDHYDDNCKYKFTTLRPSAILPYLLVNVGTGVSFILVENDAKYTRVGGSSLGGGAFFGLAQLLSRADETHYELDDLLKMAELGDHRFVDSLVSDIYGLNAEIAGLSGDIIAGSFGKCAKKDNADRIMSNPDYVKHAIRSLLLMISNSIGQLSVLYAQQLNVNRIFFNGFLIRNHNVIMRTLDYSVQFWSQKAMHAYYLRHEGYTSAIGAYFEGGSRFKCCNDDVGWEGERLSWHEYYRGCSELGRFVPTAPLSAGFTAGVLELECTNMRLRPFPLLAEDITYYKPDEVDLSINEKDREFWLNIMEKSVTGVIKKAIESQCADKDAVTRGDHFKVDFLKQLNVIREKSFAYGSCTVRNLLDLREQLLNEHGFDDTYLNQKKLENKAALDSLKAVLDQIDALPDDKRRLFMVSKGILAGNVFDWGAQKIVELMQASGGLSFDQALAQVPDRPWLEDSYDQFEKRYFSQPYKCAVVFVDNSGADCILGVIPFARELARGGTKVIIVTNLSPALNDLTYREMLELVESLKAIDYVLKGAINDGTIMFNHSGQCSPCLDLRKVHHDLNRQVIEEGVDLVVIEGMGRALHTNFSANFTCDSLKVAIIKSDWLAKRLGGELFSVVFKFETGKGVDEARSTRAPTLA